MKTKYHAWDEGTDRALCGRKAELMVSGAEFARHLASEKCERCAAKSRPIKPLTVPNIETARAINAASVDKR